MFIVKALHYSGNNLHHSHMIIEQGKSDETTSFFSWANEVPAIHPAATPASKVYNVFRGLRITFINNKSTLNSHLLVRFAFSQ
jgi:hypothetical protein